MHTETKRQVILHIYIQIKSIGCAWFYTYDLIFDCLFCCWEIVEVCQACSVKACIMLVNIYSQRTGNAIHKFAVCTQGMILWFHNRLLMVYTS